MTNSKIKPGDVIDPLQRSSRKQGILLLAHGSRRAEANRDLNVLAEKMEERHKEAVVSIGFLELTTPTIPEGAADCVSRGASDIVMLPFFLSMGTHVADDLEKFRIEFNAKYPSVTFNLAAPLGMHPLIISILEDRLSEAKTPPQPATS